MKSLPERIMEHGEATPICPAALLHIGQGAAVGQALSRLARSGRLMRIRQGVYMRPIESRFGRCAPGIEKSPQARSDVPGQRLRGGNGRYAICECVFQASRELPDQARPGATAPCIASMRAGASNAGGPGPERTPRRNRECLTARAENVASRTPGGHRRGPRSDAGHRGNTAVGRWAQSGRSGPPPRATGSPRRERPTLRWTFRSSPLRD